MNDKQFKQVLSQLPVGSCILRAYKAIEGDIRVIVRVPGKQFQQRYTVKFENDFPKIELM